jgi:hypothetical protein
MTGVQAWLRDLVDRPRDLGGSGSRYAFVPLRGPKSRFATGNSPRPANLLCLPDQDRYGPTSRSATARAPVRPVSEAGQMEVRGNDTRTG